MVIANRLHLASLSIQGFRGIDELSIPRLGQVTLLAGKNGVGKTTVLDALRVYAARGHYAALILLLRGREEVSTAIDEDSDGISVPDWPALFFGRNITKDTCIAIGPNDGSKQVIKPTNFDGEQGVLPNQMFFEFGVEMPLQAISVEFEGYRQVLPWLVPLSTIGSSRASRLVDPRVSRELRRSFEHSPMPTRMPCESLGPGVLDNSDLVRFWDEVALTDDEERAIDALRLIFGAGIQRVAMIGDDSIASRRSGRRAVVKIEGQEHPVPLRSFGGRRCAPVRRSFSPSQQQRWILAHRRGRKRHSPLGANKLLAHGPSNSPSQQCSGHCHNP